MQLKYKQVYYTCVWNNFIFLMSRCVAQLFNLCIVGRSCFSLWRRMVEARECATHCVWNKQDTITGAALTIINNWSNNWMFGLYVGMSIRERKRSILLYIQEVKLGNHVWIFWQCMLVKRKRTRFKLDLTLGMWLVNLMDLTRLIGSCFHNV
jgi:hypothetical protein